MSRGSAGKVWPDRRVPPRFGQHAGEILEDAGFGPAQVQRLAELGVCPLGGDGVRQPATSVNNTRRQTS